MMVTRLYCYVDETGQDTKGELLLVAVILKEMNDLETLQKQLEVIEQRTGKKLAKWRKTSRGIKKKYLEELIQIKELKNGIFYAKYQTSKEYSRLTSFTIAKAVLSQVTENYSVTIIIDGLNDKEREVVREELKKLKIKYRKIRGMKDEQSIFLRLSDAMAGFLREYYEGEEYTKQLLKRFEKSSIVTET